MKTDQTEGATATIENPVTPTAPSGDGGGEGQEQQPTERPFQKKMREMRNELMGEDTPPPEPEPQTETDPDYEPQTQKSLPEGWYRDSNGRVRDNRGNFAKLPTEEADAPKPVQDGPSDDADPDADHDSDPDADREAGEEGTEEGADEPLVARLPGRRPDDDEFELPLDRAALEEAGIDPKEAVDRINQLRNEGLRRQELMQHLEPVQAEKAELDAIYDAMESDPSGFLTQRVAPQMREQVARDVLLSLDAESFERVVEQVDQWARRPEARRVEAVDRENQRLKKDHDRRSRTDERKADLQLANRIGEQVVGLIPESMDDGRADRFFRLALSELDRHVAENKLTTLDPAQVPHILADLGVLSDFGLSSNGQPNPNSNGSDSASAARKGSEAQEGPKGEDVRDRMKRRRESAAVSPAGAGSAATEGFKKVVGERHEDRMKRLKKTLLG